MKYNETDEKVKKEDEIINGDDEKMKKEEEKY